MRSAFCDPSALIVGLSDTSLLAFYALWHDKHVRTVPLGRYLADTPAAHHQPGAVPSCSCPYELGREATTCQTCHFTLKSLPTGQRISMSG
jgi:hypothetical protein